MRIALSAFEMKPHFLQNHFLCWPRPGSMQCPPAPSAGRRCSRQLSRWHPASLTGVHRTSGPSPIISLKSEDPVTIAWAQRAPEWGAPSNQCFAAPTPGTSGDLVSVHRFSSKPRRLWGHRQLVQALWPSVSFVCERKR